MTDDDGQRPVTIAHPEHFVLYPKLLSGTGNEKFRLNGIRLRWSFLFPTKLVRMAGFPESSIADLRGFTLHECCINKLNFTVKWVLSINLRYLPSANVWIIRGWVRVCCRVHKMNYRSQSNRARLPFSLLNDDGKQSVRPLLVSSVPWTHLAGSVSLMEVGCCFIRASHYQLRQAVNKSEALYEIMKTWTYWNMVTSFTLKAL